MSIPRQNGLQSQSVFHHFQGAPYSQQVDSLTLQTQCLHTFSLSLSSISTSRKQDSFSFTPRRVLVPARDSSLWSPTFSSNFKFSLCITVLFTKPPVSRFTAVLNQNIRLHMRVHAKRTEPADAKSQCRCQRSCTCSLVRKKATIQNDLLGSFCTVALHRSLFLLDGFCT